ncbi:MAG: glycosyltransferase family 9 protein [Bacteroidota bacterium]|nr:glycosyltransferase family 9 protein [Bacteroidota bacterium]
MSISFDKQKTKLQKTKLHKTAAVFYSAGIGDALLLTPLVKQLKKDGYRVTGIFTSPYHVHELFEGTSLLDEKITILSKPKLVWFITRYGLNKFDRIYVNYFAANRSNILAASKTSKKVITNREVKFKLNAIPNLRYITPHENRSDAEHNLNLYTKGSIVESDFFINFKDTALEKFNLPAKYIVLQAGAGNNQTPYKMWSLGNWERLIEKIHKNFPNLSVVLLGDKNELAIGEELHNTSIVNLTGKTSLPEVISIIKNSVCLIGSDSGLMHIAASASKPSFTIWGASNEKLYGYEQFNSLKHQIIFNETISCRPCSSWISANITRVNNPMKCPDFICLEGLKPDAVFEKLSVFLSQQLNNAQ